LANLATLKILAHYFFVPMGPESSAHQFDIIFKEEGTHLLARRAKKITLTNSTSWK
jgi:hypothetical protein